MVQPLWGTAWRFLKKLKIELPYDPAIPLLDICLEKMKALSWKDICTPIFIAAFFTIAKTLKESTCLTDKWIKIGNIYIYIYNDILHVHALSLSYAQLFATL